MTKDASFDYSKVPFQFGLCAAADCPRGDTCLRRTAYDHVPANILFPPDIASQNDRGNGREVQVLPFQ